MALVNSLCWMSSGVNGGICAPYCKWSVIVPERRSIVVLLAVCAPTSSVRPPGAGGAGRCGRDRWRGGTSFSPPAVTGRSASTRVWGKDRGQQHRRAEGEGVAGWVGGQVRSSHTGYRRRLPNRKDPDRPSSTAANPG